MIISCSIHTYTQANEFKRNCDKQQEIYWTLSKTIPQLQNTLLVNLDKTKLVYSQLDTHFTKQATKLATQKKSSLFNTVKFIIILYASVLSCLK